MSERECKRSRPLKLTAILPFLACSPHFSNECVLRDRIVASVNHLVPANEAAGVRVRSFRQSLYGVDSMTWKSLLQLDQALQSLIEKGIVAHLERLAAGTSHYTDASKLLTSMKAAR
jgi:hypothetical protein